MSTCNFGTPNFGLPLICGGLDYDEKRKAYEEAEGEEYNEDMFNDEVQWEIEEIENELKEFNKNLKYFAVYLEGGYYMGYYFNARLTQDYWDFDNLDELDDEDAEYYFGDTADEVRKGHEQELNKIREYFKELKERGFYELALRGVFSNGEGVYERVK